MRVAGGERRAGALMFGGAAGEGKTGRNWIIPAPSTAPAME
jgi:hypothetical protein